LQADFGKTVKQMRESETILDPNICYGSSLKRATMDIDPLRQAFAFHPRRWRDLLYVYPVISRRSRGLSIGVNLNPDAACNFDCLYCCADREQAERGARVDPQRLAVELRGLAGMWRDLFDEPEFAQVPDEYRRLNDIAFSGDGEPTATSVFPEAVQIAAQVRRDLKLDGAKLIVITNGCFLKRPPVAAALAELDANNGEIWAKLDAGTEAYFQLVNRARCSLEHVLDNLLDAARTRPLVIQSLFAELAGAAPPADEVAAYVDRLRWLQAEGGQIARVQVYTVARKTAHAGVAALDDDTLAAIADQIKAAGITVELFT
jgi:wyosine [tRNA(Phe)-imidazoG37] synthetase (radical SAM superfamily)